MTTTAAPSATANIVKTLGSGSGIDLSALVEGLVEAQFAAKTAQITAKTDTNTARISSVGELKSGIQGFADAMAALVGGSTLSPLSTSSDPLIATATTLPGAAPVTTSTTIRVRALAAAQTSNLKAYIADPSVSQGTGTLTITLGTATVNASGAMTAFSASGTPAIAIRIDPADSSLTGMVAKINAANAGVTASIVTDANGSRLALTGATGAKMGFTVAVAEDSTARGLAKFAVGVNRTTTATPQAAANASVDVNGVNTVRTSNSLTDIIPGVRIDLQSVNTTKSITIGATRQTANLKQAVTDTVATFNELKAVIAKATDPVTGTLHGDQAVRDLSRSLSSLISTPLIPAGAAGAPRTLAELGVKTNRDGTASLDSAQLGRMVTAFPESVEQIFAAASGSGTNGISATLNSMALRATSTIFGLGASLNRYTRTGTDLTDQQADAVEAATVLRTRLTRQFASMDSRVAAYKSTQSFLTSQIAAWNKSDS